MFPVGKITIEGNEIEMKKTKHLQPFGKKKKLSFYLGAFLR